MAKPRIFISSTFYDLRHVRADLDIFIDTLGYESVRNEDGDIPYGKDGALEDYCYEEIKSVDILVSIIGGRYGSESTKGGASISQLELKMAQKENKQVYIFIEQHVLSEYETYLINKDNIEMRYKYVDDKKIYTFIEEVKSLTSNNNIKGFETASDITKYLKDQLSGLFQRFLAEQTRIKEVNLIKNLEKTADTLNRLVSYLSDENKDQTSEINRILMINHPLVESLRTNLNIPYNFYVEGYKDLNELLNARSYKSGFEDFDTATLFDEILSWNKQSKDIIKTVKIHSSMFEDDGRLKFIKKIDWNDDFIIYEETKDPNYNDLPF